MRKRFFLWLAIFCCLAFTVGILAACNGGDSTQMGGQTPADSSAYAGRYYEEVNGRLDADSWIELGDDWTWVDSDTMMGTFTVDGSSIHFYWATASEPMFDGTISDGEFTVNILGTLYKYKQGTPSADTPEEPDEGDPDDEKPEEPEGEYHTVTFDVNGGEEAVLPHEYLVGALMSLPTPTREGYRFWGWFDERGVRYDNSSVMPNEDLTLTAEWKIIVTSYEDEYIYFKPATEGKKNSDSYYDRYASSGIHHYMYLELESDSIGGPEAVGSSNNLDLASRVDMDFSVADGYTLTWYNDSGFTSINGAQRFTLGYGSNIYFLTVSEGSRVVQRYLIDFYIKYDYYISLYSNIYENESYNEENRVRVIEGEKIAFSDLEQKAERDFEFDNWAYFNYDLGKYVEFDFDVAIYKNWSLYQTFKPQTITANLSGGSLDEELLITPYTPYQQLPVPTKENYDFIGWQLADGDYFADITGYGSTTLLSDDNYFKSLKAEFRPKKYYKDVSDEGDTISFVSTIPVVFYTDESRAKIHEIYYLPTELLPCSPVPDAVPLTGDDIFLGWRSYYGTEEAEIFDFNQAIEGPTSVFPEFRAATYDSEVGISNGYTFTSDNSFDTHHVTVWLPSSGEYILTVSGKAGISVAAYGEYEASSYTSTSSRPATIVLLCDDLSGRPAAVTLKQTSGKVTLSLSGETGYSDQSQKIDPTTAKYGEFGKEVLLNARENVGGIFLGWYDEDDVQVSGKGSYLYRFTMPGNEVTYTAKWAKASVVSEDAAKGTVPQLTKKYLPGEEVSVTATTNLGYTFIGWYNVDEKVADTLTYKFEMPAEDVTYTAKWIACPVNLEVSNADAGSVGMPTTTVAGERVAITATTNPGYTFIGWYNGNEQVAATPTYEFIMPTENVTYTAKWQLCATTLTVNDENAGSVSGLEGPTIVGNKVSVIATTNPGYTFIGWYNDEEKLTDSLTYEFTMSAENVTYTAKWIKVTIESEDTTKGTVSRLTGTYLPGEEVSITATTKSGYTFIGWYNGEEKVADSLTYEFTMPEESVTYTAKWIKVTVESEDTAKGTVSQLTDTYVFGEEVSVTAATNLGYTFIGWYNGEEKVADSLTYKFEMPAENVTYTAKWMMNAEMEPFVFTSTQTSLSITGVNTKDATSLTIPSYVTHIGSDAFSGCNALASIEVDVSNTTYASVDGILYNKAKTKFVHIPDAITGDVEIPGGVTRMGDGVFWGCSRLTTITIPDSVTSIGEYAFRGCSSLASITIPFVGASKDGTSNTHFGYIFGASSYSYNDDYIPTSLKEVIITGGTSIGDYAFYDCDSLTSVTIGNGVTSIGDEAFWSCSGLTSVTIGNGVTSIANYAFSGCSNLASITIGNGVTSIANYAFSGCDSLVAVYYTGDMASWWSINGLDNIISSGRTWYIDGNKAAGDIVIPDGTTSIPSYAFEDCTGLTSVKIPDSVKSIGSGVFSGCTSLKSITIPFVGAEAGKTSSDTYQYPFGYIFGTSSYTGATEVKQYYYGNRTSSTTSTTYYISSSLRGVTVTGGNILYGAFYNCSMLTSVTIGNGVTSIGERAFLDCTGLESITIGNGVTSIGGYVFAGCSGLETVTIGSGVTSIGYGAFQGCDSLVSVHYTGDMTSWLGKSWHGEVMSSGPVLYLDGNKVEGEVVIPDGMTSIPSYAFAYQSGITSVTIPDSVTSIGSSAFSGCTAEIVWGDNPEITEIGDYAFRRFKGTSITIPDSVTSIGYEAFRGCTAEIVWGDAPKVTEIGDYAFSEYEGTSITIPDSVTAIGWYAFEACTAEIIWGDVPKITEIGDGAFCRYEGTSITIPDSVTSIGGYAFSGCTGLTSITIPDSVTSIGSFAFEDCSGLTSITIPDSVTSIANYAFSGCGNLASIIILGSVTSIESYAFSGCTNIASAKMPTLAIAYIPQDSLQTVVLTSGESIEANAFSGCTSLTSVTIPDSVTSIGEDAFSGCTGIVSAKMPTLAIAYIPKESLQTVVLTSGESIEANAFSGCTSLTSLTIPDSVTSIGSGAFSGCDNLQYNEYDNALYLGNAENPYLVLIKAKDTSITSVDIPDSTKVIYEGAFYGCSGLTSVIIPDSVTSIGDAAFASCSDLETVTIGSGVTSIGQGAFLLCNGLSSVTFKVTDGWRAYNNTSTSGVSLSSSNLSNKSTAANHLKLLYAYYYWEREVNE